jgi:lipoprotein-anchoring transpeptidase ErfK/SrfK
VENQKQPQKITTTNQPSQPSVVTAVTLLDEPALQPNSPDSSDSPDSSVTPEALPDTPDPASAVAPETTGSMSMPGLPSHHKAFLRWLLPAVGLVVILLGVVWVVGSSYFANFRLGNRLVTTRSTNSVLEQTIASAADKYQVAIAYPNGPTRKFPLDETGVSVQTAATLQSLRREQDGFVKRLKWWQAIPVQLSVTTNAATLRSFVANYASVTMKPAANASLSIDNGSVDLTSATAGKAYGLPNADRQITAQASRLQTSPLTLQVLTLEPSLTSAELAGPEAAVKQAISQHVTITMGTTNGQTVTPSASDLASWIELTPNLTTKTVDISVNGATVTAYLTQIASANDHPARDQVSITDATGNTSVAVPGQDSSSVSGEQAAAATIVQNLAAGKGIQVNLPVTSTPYGSITAGNWSKWIEVDTVTKRMYAYQYGQVVNTFLVSAGAPATPTPTGQFAIWDKLPSQTMVGPGYVQPNVPWVNYFDHSGDAIHGNYWRPASVFGNTNTSHGCVGVQDSEAVWIYNWGPIGTPVIIHK